MRGSYSGGRYLNIGTRPRPISVRTTDASRQRHWFAADLALQYDALVHIDSTRAVEPLEGGALREAAEPSETYRTAL
jgi:hypothetical protein